MQRIKNVSTEWKVLIGSIVTIALIGIIVAIVVVVAGVGGYSGNPTPTTRTCTAVTTSYGPSRNCARQNSREEVGATSPEECEAACVSDPTCFHGFWKPGCRMISGQWQEDKCYKYTEDCMPNNDYACDEYRVWRCS